MNRETTCAFTGHRWLSKQQCLVLEKQLETMLFSLTKQGFTDFCSGGALGFDQLAAKTVLKLKQKMPGVHLVMVLPCKDQDAFWKPTQKEAYRALISEADRVIYTDDCYHNGCMQKRTRHMVDSSACVLAYLNHNRGGTKYTVNYAEKTGVPVLFLNGDEPMQMSVFSQI